MTFGSSTVRLGSREIEGPAGTVRVKPKSMEVLLALARRPRTVHSRKELLADVWKGAWVGEEVLTQAISQLRRAFDDDPRSPRIIETVPRRGYRLLVVPQVGGSGGGKAFGRLPSFVGRRSEHRELLEALNRAEKGRGGVIFLAGEPGIGKTRLAEEVLSHARDRNFLALVGRCSEEIDALPMLAFVETVERASRIVPQDAFRAALGDSAPAIARMVPSLRRRFPGLPPPVELPPEHQRRYLFNAFLEFLERGSEISPLCLFLDDLQWADEATCLLLRHVAWETGRLKILVLGAFRDTELDRAPAFRRALAELLRQRLARQLSLDPLTGREIRELLGRLSGVEPREEVVKFFRRTTEGNPFFVEEVYWHLAGRLEGREAVAKHSREPTLSETDLPEGVRVVISQRVSRLAEGTRELLTAASVVGRTFDPQLARRLTALDDEEDFASAMDEAESAGLVAPRTIGAELRYEFSHDLIRHSLLSEISVVRRRMMHARAVDAMEALYPDVEARAAEIASHLERAGDAADPEKALRYSILAAERVLDTAASEDALRFLDRAVARAPAGDRAIRARILFLRGYALRSLLRWEEAIRDWREAIPLFEEIGDVASLARTCKDMAIMAQWRNRWSEAIALAQRGLALAGPEPSAERVHLLCHAGLGHSGGGRFEEGDRILAEAESVARLQEDPELLGEVLFYRSGSALFQMRAEDQLVHARRSTELLRGTTNLWDFVPALEFAHMALFCLGRFGEMKEQEPEIERLADRTGHVGTTLFLHHTGAHRELLELGDLEAFAVGASKRLEAGIEAGFPWAPSQSYVELGRVAWWRGEREQAEAHFRKARDLESESPLSGIAPAAHVLFLARRGDRAALDLVAERESLLPEAGRPAGIGSWHLLLAAVEASALLGEVDRAAAMHPLVLHGRSQTGARVPLWSSVTFSRVAGISAAAAGRWEEAEDHFDKARGECEAMPNLLERPAVLYWLAWMLERRRKPGDGALSDDLMAESRNALREIGTESLL